ncbi:MAG TPA: hypothetical protein VK211_12705 [Kamptonema sp.]|nr:hypothetical protein [Kamptonema sp.]
MPKTNLRRVTSYIEPKLYESLAKLAKSDRRTISQMIGVLIENAVLKAKEEGKIDQ